jgi:hypothetical protein
MMRVGICMAALTICAVEVGAQTCPSPEAARSWVPSDAPPEQPYAPQWVSGQEGSRVPLGSGHVHLNPEGPYPDLPPGAYDWLSSLVLPLFAEAGGDPFAWILEGWIVSGAGDPVALSRNGLIETGYEELSFAVLERADSWLRIRYDQGEDDSGLAWVPDCALSEGPVALVYTPWSEWLVSDRISPLFFRSEEPGSLFEAPGADTAVLSDIAGDYHLEPQEVRGDWMRVILKMPSDYCEFDIEPATREGWIRWSEPERGPRVWYYTRGC